MPNDSCPVAAQLRPAIYAFVCIAMRGLPFPQPTPPPLSCERVCKMPLPQLHGYVFRRLRVDSRFSNFRNLPFSDGASTTTYQIPGPALATNSSSACALRLGAFFRTRSLARACFGNPPRSFSVLRSLAPSDVLPLWSSAGTFGPSPAALH